MKRDIVMNFRITPKLNEKIKKQAEKSNMTISTYVYEVLLKSNIIVIEEGKDIYLKLNKMGNNLNELAKKLNLGIATQSDMKILADTSKGLNEICQLLENIKLKLK